jgi:hypothetical protein
LSKKSQFKLKARGYVGDIVGFISKSDRHQFWKKSLEKIRVFRKILLKGKTNRPHKRIISGNHCLPP